ncbi:hypothetical protein H5410_016315 [Solanum commersonii]|uniref:SET domain protein n=1 Tax=Solanum commersonii TaxID=4109 RepID=A0A9J5ZWN5_SOLCO|nr:hypothetical protein H5410_016315 [Solanum commersonii]
MALPLMRLDMGMLEDLSTIVAHQTFLLKMSCITMSIAPLEEFTYHYNYDHVYDKNRNLKRKNCRCGSRKCEGRINPKRNPTRNNNLKVESDSLRRKDEDGFTFDAIRYGNVGRFINHSCSPNLYAQNVMYYHGDRRVPHIMFFASKSIAPLEEFTYHYNYDHVCDKNSNLKRKNCRCGSRKCEGRILAEIRLTYHQAGPKS